MLQKGHSRVDMDQSFGVVEVWSAGILKGVDNKQELERSRSLGRLSQGTLVVIDPHETGCGRVEALLTFYNTFDIDVRRACSRPSTTSGHSL
jgi:hypothetical protein